MPRTRASAPGVVPSPAGPDARRARRSSDQGSPATPACSAVDQVAAVLDGCHLRSVLQPVVDLRSNDVVAHGALLRGPAGSELASPLALMEAARAAGRAAELDVAALRTHLEHAEQTMPGLDPILFVNLEPATLTAALGQVLEVLADRPEGQRVVVEFTERALTTDPAAVIEATERIRALGCAIALDDVGAEPASLAFVPLLRPEVVKLDLGLLRTVDDPATITVAHAVRAYAEEFGREVVAEGVEVREDRTRAVVLGATLGQGWYWGYPSAEPHQPAHGFERIYVSRPRETRAPRTPFDLLRPSETQAGPKDLLRSVSRGLELAALQSRVRPVLLSSFQDVRNFGRPTQRRYEKLAGELPLVGVVGHRMPDSPAPGVRGAALRGGDPLGEEWTVVVLGPHEAVALIARIRPESDRQESCGAEAGDVWFDFAVTHDRARVTAAALLLLERLGARAS